MASLNANAKVEMVVPGGNILPEGPFYEAETNTLLWVDIMKFTLNFLEVGTWKNRTLTFEETISAVIPVEGSSSQLVALIGRKICIVDRNTGSVVSILDEVDKDKPKNRFNDGKCDSSGRLWCGTMYSNIIDFHSNEAKLHSRTAGVTTGHIVTSLSNGIEWNHADDTMYFIDSLPSKKVYSFSYNREDGSISSQEVLLDYSKDQNVFPDGMTIDTEGRLWIAGYGSQKVVCWDPKTKEKLCEVKIPGALRPTSCCFGGPDYEWLFVTTTSEGASEEEWANYPNSGGVFVVKDLGAKGLPANKFKWITE